jgi:ABC-type ATPase with predicted acetyltransferase domain
MVSDIKVSIKNLYKIFGPNGKDMVQKVEDGATKSSLQAEHGHVLGLSNVNIDIPARRIQVIMGLSGSGKSTIMNTIGLLDRPSQGKYFLNDADVILGGDEWTLGITAQGITENMGTKVIQNEWTMAIASQEITETAGVAVIQGTSSGTLKTTLNGGVDSVVITAAAGVAFAADADSPSQSELVGNPNAFSAACSLLSE